MALPSYFYVVAATKYRGSPVSQVCGHCLINSSCVCVCVCVCVDVCVCVCVITLV